MKRYLTPWRAKASRISSAWRYSNAAIAEPRGQMLLAPLAVRRHRVERAERPLVEAGLFGMDECVPHAQRQRPLCRRFEVREPVCGDSRRRLHRVILPTNSAAVDTRRIAVR